MWKKNALLAFSFYILINYCHSTLPEDIADAADECLTNSLETSLYCRGSRAINNIINNLSKTDKPIVIVRGLEIVPSNRPNNYIVDNKTDTKMEESGLDDDTLLGRFSHYLRTHELNIKFSDLMTFDESERIEARDLEQHGMQINLMDEARKKDKGFGMLMALGFILSKTMAIMGLGGVGTLAMKALGIAMTALMMAGMVGMKTMTHQGGESTHSVQYLTADGHHHLRRRRRRSTGNKHIFSDTQYSSNSGDTKHLKLPSLIYGGWKAQ